MIGAQERHVPTATSLHHVERLLNCYDWPTEIERMIHKAIKVVAASSGYPVTVDQIVETLAPGFPEWVQANHIALEPLTPMVSNIIKADGRWGRLEVIERDDGHHRVAKIVLDASEP